MFRPLETEPIGELDLPQRWTSYGEFIIYFCKQSKRAIPCCVGMLNMTWPCSKSFIMCEDFIQRKHNTAARHIPEQLVFRFSCLIWRPPPNTKGILWKCVSLHFSSMKEKHDEKSLAFNLEFYSNIKLASLRLSSISAFIQFSYDFLELPTGFYRSSIFTPALTFNQAGWKCSISFSKWSNRKRANKNKSSM